MNIHCLSVDDNEVNLMLVETLAEDMGMTVESFTNPFDALKNVENNSYDIIFVDYMMPEMDGITLIKNIRKFLPDTPVVMMTAVGDDNKIKLDALEAGATDFLPKPLNVPEFKARVTNLAKLSYSQKLLKDRALLLEEEVKIATKEILEREKDALTIIGRAADFKDNETGNHVKRVAAYAKTIAEGIGLSYDEQDIICYSAPLHDIGKIGIADSILLKSGKLTDEEFKKIKLHTSIGYSILKNSHGKYLKMGSIIALGHHEKWDGSGYPKRLKGENIHIAARIVAIADVFDALTSDRPYKKKWPYEDAAKYILEQAGGHFDPYLTKIFEKKQDKFIEILKELGD